MKIEFEIDLDADEAALMALLDSKKPEELARTLSLHALAALHEHLECYLGRRASTRGTDILEHRLVLLTRHAFGNRIPNDVTVSRLFQTTLTASRTMIRNMLARYRSELGDASTASAKALLETVKWPGSGDDYLASNPARNVVELLNQQLLIADPSKKQISRVAESGGVFAINKYSYDKLCDVFKATKVPQQ